MASIRRGLRSILTNVSQRIQTESNTTVLAGTAASHRCYILIHSSQPPTEFPSRISTEIQRSLQLKVTRWGGIVNFSWFADQPQNIVNRHSATAFSISGGRLEIPELSLENIDKVEEQLKKHVQGPPMQNAHQQVHLYVCTHGARDCRCGNIGVEVVKALRAEVERRTKIDPYGIIGRVKVGEVGHVGGHQLSCIRLLYTAEKYSSDMAHGRYAANLLVFPHGEWCVSCSTLQWRMWCPNLRTILRLGRLKPDDVPGVLETIINTTPRPLTPHDPPLVPLHWRGRMGLGKDQQLQLYASYQLESGSLS